MRAAVQGSYVATACSGEQMGVKEAFAVAMSIKRILIDGQYYITIIVIVTMLHVGTICFVCPSHPLHRSHHYKLIALPICEGSNTLLVTCTRLSWLQVVLAMAAPWHVGGVGT